MIEVGREEGLVERARAGDRAAFAELCSRHAGPLAAFAGRELAHLEEGRDIAQASLARALEQVAALEDARCFRAWLYRIALNECRKRKRGESRLKRALSTLRELASRREAPVELASDEAARVRRALAKLPEKQRLAVELRVWEGLSCAEAALALECTEGTIKANFHHALTKLRADLGDEHAL